MNTECNRIAYALASAINGEAWYGDSLREILDKVTAKHAQARPLPMPIQSGSWSFTLQRG